MLRPFCYCFGKRMKDKKIHWTLCKHWNKIFSVKMEFDFTVNFKRTISKRENFYAIYGFEIRINFMLPFCFKMRGAIWMHTGCLKKRNAVWFKVLLQQNFRPFFPLNQKNLFLLTWLLQTELKSVCSNRFYRLAKSRFLALLCELSIRHTHAVWRRKFNTVHLFIWK